MKFYLSSYKLGDKSEKLKEMCSGKVSYIPNACDFTNVNLRKREERTIKDLADLSHVGLEAEILDLQDYFGKEKELRDKLRLMGGVFVRGGNTFILRQAMKLSGFDIIFNELLSRDDFLYSGYSAGICVLASSLKSLQIVDNPTDMPYPEIQEIIWEGLGFLDYMILPHYDSPHPESADIDKEIEYCIENKLLFKTLRDGEVIIIDK